MTNKKLLAVIMVFAHSQTVFSESIKFIETPVIYLPRTSNLTVNNDAQTTLESFTRNWSQFEILVAKEDFPIDAPNCKSTIQIRFKGLEPVKNQINQVQKSRWELLERIRNSDDREYSPIFLYVDTKHYMKKSQDGKYKLDYCNVFVE